MSSLKAFEADGWNAQASSYDLLTGRVTARLAASLLDAADVMAGVRVLDVGCGTGVLSAAACRRGASPLGVDLAEAMVKAARATLPGVEFGVADAESLPYPDDRFDAAVGGFVLNHLPRPRNAVDECVRVVAPGGRVAFAIWEHPEHCRLIGILGDAIERAGGDREAGQPGGPDEFRYADRGRMRQLLQDAGLQDVRVDVARTTVRCTDSGELWDGLLGGLIRAPAALAAHDEPTRQRIRSCFDELAAEFGARELDLPASAVIGTGRVAT